MQIFAAARKVGAAIEPALVTTGRPGTVVAAYRTRVIVETGWSPEAADLLVVPGGGYNDRDAPGVWAQIRRGDLPKALAAAKRPGLTISSVCTGAMVLAAAGLTHGRPCTTHHMAKMDLADQGGLVRDARVVDDGGAVWHAPAGTAR